MTGTELALEVRRMIHDEDSASISTTRMIDAINNASDRLCERGKNKGMVDFTRVMNITSGDAVPNRFMDFAGSYPITRKDDGTGDKFYHSLGGAIEARYYYYRDHITALGDTLNYKTGFLTELAELTARECERYLGKDVSQDTTILAERAV